MSSLGFLRGRVDRPQRPSPALEVHRGLRRAHLPHAAGDAAHLLRGTQPATVGSSSGDAVLIPILVALWQANFSVYGIHKLWIAAKKAGHDVGRDQVARLMRTAGIRGVQRRRGVTTTKRRRGADVAPDLVHRVFRSERPNALWVSDLTDVRTTEGMADVCVRRRHEVHDRRLAGRLADDGPDGPPGPRGGPAPPGCVPRRSLVLPRSGPLRCREPVLKRSRGHAPGRDRRGSFRRFGRRQLRQRTPQSVNAFYKAELVFGPGRGAWRDVSHREAVTVSSFTWWNETRIHGSLGDRSPPVRAGRRCRRPHHQRGRNPRYGVFREARVNQWRAVVASPRSRGVAVRCPRCASVSVDHP